VFAIIGLIFSFIFSAASAVADFIATIMWPIVLSLVSWARAVWAFVRPAWDLVVQPVAEFVDGLYDGLHQFLLDHFSWLLPWVAKATDFAKLIYLDILKPIRDVFTAVRNVLDILKALHVPFAAALEADLNALETKILGPLMEVVNTINNVAQIIQGLILDPAGLLLRSTLLSSLLRDQQYVARLVFAYELRPGPAYHPASTDHRFPVRETSVYTDTFDAGVDGDDYDGQDLITMAESSFDEMIGADLG
jgi:hypothetical protein